LDGTWTLEVATPFGKHPATLSFERDGGADEGARRGHIKSRLGDVPLTDIKDHGNSFNAIVVLTLQGGTYEATVDGQTVGDEITGTINVKFPLAPKIKFTGTRAK